VLPGLERLRFASPHPRHTTSTLIAAMRDLPRVCKQLHLPLQSGSTRVLAAMRRRHTRDEYLRLVEEVRAAVPNIVLSTDLIVGFPGESRADFDDTLSLVRAVQFQAVYSFKYSPRPNTLAAKRMPDDVTEDEKTARIVELQALQREIQLVRHQSLVGTTTDVLVEAASRRRAWELSGRTDGNMVVNFSIPADTSEREPGSWIGRTVQVTITRGGPNSVSGTMAAPQRQQQVS